MVNVLRDEIARHSTSLGLTGLVELHDIISQDREPLKQVQGVYLFGQTSDQEGAIFQSVEQIRDRGLSAPVFVLNDHPEDPRYKPSGYPGFASWSQKLKQGYGIDALPLEPSDPGNLNTFSEAQALVAHSKAQGTNSWYAVAAQFHMLRGFISAASVAIKQLPSLNVFAYHGADQDWDEVATHSQGKLRKTRRELIQTEMERIQTYTAKGDLESAQKILEYVEQRRL